jgi:hypothetical protein
MTITKIKQCLEQKHIRFCGVQQFGSKNLILFDNPYGSTISIPEDMFSEDNVRIRLEDSMRKWNERR